MQIGKYKQKKQSCATVHSALVFFIVAHSSIVQATTPREQIDRQLRLDSEKQVFDRLRRQQKDRATPHLELKRPKVKESSESPCFPIKKIDVNGATLIPPGQMTSLLKKHIGACKRISDLKSITSDINDWYMEAGYITSLAYLAEQDMADYQIEVTVLEGKIESFQDPVAEKPNGVFWGQTGDYLNLLDLEVSVDRMNRLLSHQSKIDLQPGSEKGLTIVKVTTEQKSPWRLNTTVNNFGSESTGKAQWNLSFDWDNPLGLYDQLTLSKGINTPYDEYQGSQNHSVGYSLPFGRLLASYRYSQSAYQQPIEAGVLIFESSGQTRNDKLTLDYRLYHDKKTNWTLKDF